MQGLKGESAYRPDIDGLRAVAVLAVLVFHAFPRILPGGFIGVDVFFVISGFLISGIILDDLERGNFSFTTFYARRARRIFPALALVLMATLAAGWLLLPPGDYVHLARHVVAAAFSGANFLLQHEAGYFGPEAETQPLLNLWSLGIEEQFYLAWPALLLVAWRWRGSKGVFGLIAIGVLASFIVSLALRDSPVALFYAPHTRAWELLIGAGLAYLLRRYGLIQGYWAVPAALALVLAAFLLREHKVVYPWWALVPTLATVVLIATGQASWIGRSILGAKPVVAIGLISYPLYLWHWPVLWALRTADKTESAAVLIGLAASFLLAWGTYAFIERPLRRGVRPNFRNALMLSGPVAAAAFCASLVVAGDGLPGRIPKQLQALASYKFDTGHYYRSGTCFHTDPGPESFAADCFAESKDGRKRILIWGDSSSAALYPGLHGLDRLDYNVAQLSSGACPPFRGDHWPLMDPKRGKQQSVAVRPRCAAVNAFVLDYLRKSMPEVIVLSAAFIYGIDYPRLMAQTVAELRQLGASAVIVVGSPPTWPDNLPTRILRASALSGSNGADLNTLDLPKKEFARMSRLDAELERSVIASGATYVSAYRLLCREQRCTVLIDGEPVSFDRFHLTVPASTLVARAIQNSLTPLIITGGIR